MDCSHAGVAYTCEAEQLNGLPLQCSSQLLFGLRQLRDPAALLRQAFLLLTAPLLQHGPPRIALIQLRLGGREVERDVGGGWGWGGKGNQFSYEMMR